jgi:ribosomal RNA-processing protein 9
MPRLNLRKTAGKPSSLKKGKVTGAKLTPFALKSNGKDDDISSDEEEDIMESGKKRKVSTEAEAEAEEEKYAYETAEEKRRRLAQQYLKNISNLESEDEEGDSGEDDTNGGVYQSISEKLKRERLKSQGRWAVELAPQFEAVNFQEDTVTSHYGGHQGSITSLSVTQDESFIVTGSKDNAVIRFDTETGHRQILKRKWQRALDGDNQSHHGEILAVAVTSDGKYVASGGRDRIVRIHDSRMENSEIHTFSAHRDAISGLCFQTGTYSLFSSSFDRCIKYFDLNEMAYVETAFGHQVLL